MSEHAHSPNIAAGEPPHLSAHESAPEHTADPFTAAEWDQLRKEDYYAAQAVVVLLIGIFSTGIVIYTIVAAAVMS